MGLPPRHILACTDFSEPSAAAEQRAAELARAHGARLSLLTVLPASMLRDAVDLVADRYFPRDEPRFDPQRIEQDLAERIRERAGRLARAEGVACEPIVRTGRAAYEIAAAAREHRSDLVVLGQRGQHSIAAAMVGTTTQKLLRLAPCPVLTVKGPSRGDYRTILLPTDFSEASVDAMRQTAALVPAATFHVAHAFELPYEGLLNFAGVEDRLIARDAADEEKRLQPDLVNLRDAVGFDHPRVTLHLEHGYPPRMIDRWLAGLRPDLVGIAAHGKGEVERLFLGSVSLHVALSAPCDVLLVRGDERP